MCKPDCTHHGERRPPATLVLRGGTVVTVDPSLPRAEAIAVRGDRIVAVGANDDISRYVGPETEVVELAGRMAMPGFIEGHGHFLSLGFSRMQLDLTEVKSWDEVVQMVGDTARSAEPGQWIFGRGWHQSKWDAVPEPSVDGLPVHDALSRVSPDNPVFLGHASGHAAFANAKAMELGGSPRTLPTPRGGRSFAMLGVVRPVRSVRMRRLWSFRKTGRETNRSSDEKPTSPPRSVSERESRRFRMPGRASKTLRCFESLPIATLSGPAVGDARARYSE